MRLPTLKKRIDVIWIAAALIAGTGGAVFATASSSADDPAGAPAGAPAGELQLAATNDPALASSDPGDAEASARLAAAAGVPPATNAPPQSWKVGGQSVLGYTTADGSFCFEFVGGAGGCLQAGTLTDEHPVDVTTDHSPGLFHAYGLALDGVVAVSIRVDGRSQGAAFAHNAFYLSDESLGGTAGLTGEAIATMSDGTTRSVPFRVGSMEDVPLPLP